MATLSAAAAARIRARATTLAEEWARKAAEATDPEQRAAAQALSESHARRAASIQAGQHIGQV